MVWLFAHEIVVTTVCCCTKLQLLLKNRGSDGAESCAGWAYEHGKGRVCYLAPGHVRTRASCRQELRPGYPLVSANYCVRTSQVLLRGQYSVELPHGEPHALVRVLSTLYLVPSFGVFDS